MSRPVALAVVWTVVIVVACTVPGERLPPAPFLSFDKLVHVAMFAPLAFLWRRALGPRDLAVLVGSAALAVLIELWQALPFIGRTGDVGDAVADIVGALVGLAAARALARRRPA